MTSEVTKFRHPQGDSDSEYRVFPGPPEPITVTEQEIRGQVFSPSNGCGCLVAFWTWCVMSGGVLVLISVSKVYEAYPVLFMSLYLVVSLIVAPILGFKLGSLIDRRWAAKELAEKKAEVARKAREDEARSLTARLLAIRQSSVERAAHMVELLHDARAWLRQAEKEFSDSAFDPFWEAVQHSAVCLAQFCANGQELARNAEWYYAALRGRRHTFPPFPVNLAELPDPTPIVDNLRSIVRRGQTNFQFAMIWEQYKTREVLVYGFVTLGQAISGLSEAVSSVENLLKKANKMQMG